MKDVHEELRVWDEWMKDQEWEAHVMQMLAVSLIASIILLALAMVWISGTEEGVAFIGWLFDLL